MRAQAYQVPGKHPIQRINFQLTYKLVISPFFLPQTWRLNCRNVGCNAIHGLKVRHHRSPNRNLSFLSSSPLSIVIVSYHYSGYLESCRSIVTTARTIANYITTSIPELYVLGSPPASVVAFASKHPQVDALEVGDGMAKRGWHLNAISGPSAVHIACTVRLSLSCNLRLLTDP